MQAMSETVSGIFDWCNSLRGREYTRYGVIMWVQITENFGNAFRSGFVDIDYKATVQ